MPHTPLPMKLLLFLATSVTAAFLRGGFLASPTLYDSQTAQAKFDYLYSNIVSDNTPGKNRQLTSLWIRSLVTPDVPAPFHLRPPPAYPRPPPHRS